MFNWWNIFMSCKYFDWIFFGKYVFKFYYVVEKNGIVNFDEIVK